MHRLVLIDGNAIMHRAFHALPEMINSKGQHTNAIYGFVAMLIRVIEELAPTHIAVAFDRPKPTFRTKLYKEYQAQRPKMDESLGSQFAPVHIVLETLGIPIFELDGYEADDVLGTIANQAAGKKINQVIIVTGDRDLLQLVTDKVKLFMPVKAGLADAKLFGEVEAKERMGVKPAQIADLKGLMGDPSDNYPGVAGIGPKTAIGLLDQFGSVKELLKNTDQIKNLKVREKIEHGTDDLLLSQKLATVVTDAPITFDLEKATLPQDFLTREIIELFGEFEFKTLLKRLSKLSGKEIVTEVAKDDKKKATNEEQMGLF